MSRRMRVMPLLNIDELEALQRRGTRVCKICHQAVRQNYCRECDEYFEAGHAGSGVDDARCNNRHDRHRTY